LIPPPSPARPGGLACLLAYHNLYEMYHNLYEMHHRLYEMHHRLYEMYQTLYEMHHNLYEMYHNLYEMYHSLCEMHHSLCEMHHRLYEIPVFTLGSACVDICRLRLLIFISLELAVLCTYLFLGWPEPQNHIYTLYMTVHLVISLPKMPYIPCWYSAYKVLASPTYFCTDLWLTCLLTHSSFLTCLLTLTPCTDV
jgi:hypothetical protein